MPACCNLSITFAAGSEPPATTITRSSCLRFSARSRRKGTSVARHPIISNFVISGTHARKSILCPAPALKLVQQGLVIGDAHGDLIPAEFAPPNHEMKVVTCGG